MAIPTSPWGLACGILGHRARPGESCEQTMNRLWAQGVDELRPYISRGSVDIYLEHWRLDRVAALLGRDGAAGETVVEAGDPPVVVRWRSQDYLIDGRGRIAGLVKRGEKGPHEMVILDIGNVAGDI